MILEIARHALVVCPGNICSFSRDKWGVGEFALVFGDCPGKIERFFRDSLRCPACNMTKCTPKVDKNFRGAR